MNEQSSLKRGFKWLSIRHLKRKPREIDRKGRGAEVASVKRNSERRKELQKAEYRNRKDGMATGRTEEERSTAGTAVRGKREEGKGKNGRLSSQNRAKADERKLKQGESPKAKAKGKHRWNSCGSETGRDERKQTESRVRRTGKEDTGNQVGENGESCGSESGRGGTGGSHCEAEPGRKRKGRSRG